MNRYHMITALLLALVLPRSAEAVLVTLDVSDTDIVVGQTFAVNVQVDGEGIGEELLAFGFDVATSGGVLSYLGYTMGSLFDDFSDPSSPGNVTGAAFPGVGDDDVQLATLSFSADAVGIGALSIEGLFDGLFYGLFYEISGFDIIAGADIVVREAVVPEPDTVLLFLAGFFALLVVKRRVKGLV